MESPVSDRWLAYTRPNPCSRLRLFCFPYAGGGASIFRAWSHSLPETVEVCPVELPGRGTRLMEPPFTEFSSLSVTTTNALYPYLDQPFALFGHSVGALIAFEVARRLRREHSLSPVYVFVSGCRGPQLPVPKPYISTLPEDNLLEELRRLNGTPKEVLEQAELMQLMIPILRADFAVDESYTYLPDSPLDCPISAFGGLQDPIVRREELAAWAEQTQASFTLRMLPGDHFFLNTMQSLLLALLAHELQQIAGSLGP
jgi:medium-chain acyl-[acyl-carrier-protein] hydrolase